MPRDLLAAIIVIGNEILSGKVVDTNAPFLTRELRAIGVTLKRILTIPDEVDEIAEAVKEFRPRRPHARRRHDGGDRAGPRPAPRAPSRDREPAARVLQGARQRRAPENVRGA